MTFQSIHNSFWLRGDPLRQRFDTLAGVHQTEILVIGAGITGLSVALELALRGHTVTVCEAETIGAGTTGGSSGHLDAHPETGPLRLLNQLGEENARQYTATRLRAIRTIAERAGNGSGFVNLAGYHYSESAGDADALREEHEAARQIGLNVTWSNAVPIPRGRWGYRIDEMARIDCMHYLRRLRDLAVVNNVQIFEDTRVATPGGNRPRSLATDGGEVHFEHVVCATHCNYTSSMGLCSQTIPYLSYVLVARVADPPPDALFWDNSKPYYYIRRVGEAAKRLVMVGGCDHRSGMDDPCEAYQCLASWVRQRFEIEEIVSHWSAELFESVDGLPLIGKSPGTGNVWIATGLSGIGLTLGTAAGEMLADLIECKPSPLEDVFSPSRFEPGEIESLVHEQVTATANYANDGLPTASIRPDDLGPGQGLVGRIGGEQVAICRDRWGNLHCHSPICSHRGGGIVHWNELEQTWDCPVHGGRFSASGERIYGPPASGLGTVHVNEQKTR